MFFLDVVQNWIIFLNIFDILWRIVFRWLELWIKSIEHRIKGKEMIFCPLKIFKKSSKSSCCLKVSKLLGIVFVPKSCVSNLDETSSRNVFEVFLNFRHPLSFVPFVVKPLATSEGQATNAANAKKQLWSLCLQFYVGKRQFTAYNALPNVLWWRVWCCGHNGHNVHGGVDARQRPRAKIAQCAFRIFFGTSSVVLVPEVHDKSEGRAVFERFGNNSTVRGVFFLSAAHDTTRDALTPWLLEQLLAGKCWFGGTNTKTQGIFGGKVVGDAGVAKQTTVCLAIKESIKEVSNVMFMSQRCMQLPCLWPSFA